MRMMCFIGLSFQTGAVVSGLDRLALVTDFASKGAGFFLTQLFSLLLEFLFTSNTKDLVFWLLQILFQCLGLTGLIGIFLFFGS